MWYCVIHIVNYVIYYVIVQYTMLIMCYCTIHNVNYVLLCNTQC